MDPYLESEELWRGFHHHLADEVMAQLNSKLSDKYYADVEVRATLEEVNISSEPIIYPDVGVLDVMPRPSVRVAVLPAPSAPIQRLAWPAEQAKLRAVHVYVSATKTLVTTIEILSPVNKRGDGLEQYRQKRSRILRSAVHLVEIDLLRGGRRPGWEVNEPPIESDYILLLNRAGDARLSEIWPVALNEPLPLVPVPLIAPDQDVMLDLRLALDNIYQRAVYARRIDYDQPVPPPKLRPTIAAWLAQQPM